MSPRYPESPVFYRKLRREFPLAERGEGVYVYDALGKRYLDACGGAFVANLGHGCAAVAEALVRQAGRMAYVNGTAFTHEPAEALAAELARLFAPLDKAYFLGSGSEAVEAALKLARQYWAELGRPSKSRIIALKPAYHGNTLLALSASAREHYKTFYGGWLVDVSRIPAPYAYRCPCRGGLPPCSACSARALEEEILRLGAENVAAFIAEPVGGSSTGAHVPAPEYLRAVRRVCDRHEVLFVADEVLCGMGRTGFWSALEPSGVVPDILVLGKGLSGGYVPLSALLTSRRLLDPIALGSGAFLHAQTFSHHPVACAAGLAAVRELESRGLVERCRELGGSLHARLRELLKEPEVGDVRGRGLLAGIEFVENKETREPFPRHLRVAETFAEVAQGLGLLVWPNVGHSDGERGDLILLAPPFIVSEDQLDEMLSLLRASLAKTREALHEIRNA